MVNYRRARIVGATYFFTVTLHNRQSCLLVERIDERGKAFRAVRRQRMFYVDAIVVLPARIHAVWTLPEGDADFPGHWRAIKVHFTRSLVRWGVNLKRDARGEYNIWQRRYWEHLIRYNEDLVRPVDYIPIIL